MRVLISVLFLATAAHAQVDVWSMAELRAVATAQPDATIVLRADLAGDDLPPIGVTFTGTLDFNGHEIAGRQYLSPDETNVGIFAHMLGATIIEPRTVGFVVHGHRNVGELVGIYQDCLIVGGESVACHLESFGQNGRFVGPLGHLDPVAAGNVVRGYTSRDGFVRGVRGAGFWGGVLHNSSAIDLRAENMSVEVRDYPDQLEEHRVGGFGYLQNDLGEGLPAPLMEGCVAVNCHVTGDDMVGMFAGYAESGSVFRGNIASGGSSVGNGMHDSLPFNRISGGVGYGDGSALHPIILERNRIEGTYVEGMQVAGLCYGFDLVVRENFTSAILNCTAPTSFGSSIAAGLIVTTSYTGSSCVIEDNYGWPTVMGPCGGVFTPCGLVLAYYDYSDHEIRRNWSAATVPFPDCGRIWGYALTYTLEGNYYLSPPGYDEWNSAIGLSDAEARLESSFPEFAFDTVWVMGPSGYPELRSHCVWDLDGSGGVGVGDLVVAILSWDSAGAQSVAGIISTWGACP